MGEPGIFVSHVGCVVLSGMVPFVGWRRFTKENHSSKDGKFSCLAGSEPYFGAEILHIEVAHYR